MKVSVFGLGYVGCVTAACLADLGHDVWGVDVSPDKVEMINAGKSPIVEARVGDLIGAARAGGRLRATADAAEAVRATNVSLVCVGTPSQANGNCDRTALANANRQIGAALATKPAPHCVAFRSTLMPGTVRAMLIPDLERASGKQAHRDFDVCVNPEFLREGTAVADFYDPPFVVIGEHGTGGEALARMYDGVRARVDRTTYEVAEVLKYACNAFHAIKVSFANEMGALCKGLGIDSHRVMELFVKDQKLNISPAYLKPGFAFGGSCLPKDLRALLYAARQHDLTLPLLGAVLESNRVHLERTLQWILATGLKRVGLVGLSFKAGTDDLRESPSVALIETLIGKGFQVKIYDADVFLARIFGANKRFIESEIPHISSLMCSDLDEVIRESDLLVVSKPIREMETALAEHHGKLVLDLVRLPLNGAASLHKYEGICW
ncbi:MAG: nucleotide sugar dehydrogenase [Candidatus Rokuibacteriota bacterium]